MYLDEVYTGEESAFESTGKVFRCYFDQGWELLPFDYSPRLSKQFLVANIGLSPTQCLCERWDGRCKRDTRKGADGRKD